VRDDPTLTPPSTERELTPVDYLRPVWRFKFVLVPLVVLVAFAVYKVSQRQTPVYDTSTTIYVGQSNVDSLLAGAGGTQGMDQRQVANQARLIASRPVAARVAKILKTSVPPDYLLGAIGVTTDPNSDFITIRGSASSAQDAAAVTNAFAQAYLDFRRVSQTQATQQALTTAKARLANLTPKRRTGQEGSALQVRITDLQNNLLLPPQVGEQTVRADPPGAATSPKPKRNAIFGGVFALLLGIILAFVFDRSDRRLRKPEEAEEAYGVPVLAALPRTRRPAPIEDGQVTVARHFREPMRTLRVNLGFAARDRALRSLLVTSAVPEEGKSTVVRNLALGYAEAGSRVVVVEADLRKPSLAKLFGVEAGAGLGDVLHQETSLEEATVPVYVHTIPGVRPHESENGNSAAGQGIVELLTAGHALYDPTSLLTPERMRPIVMRLLERFDVVLIDSPPVLAVSDSLQLLEAVDGAVIVSRASVTTTDAAKRVRKTLQRVKGAPVLGVVFNGLDDGSEQGYGYYGSSPDKRRGSAEAAAARTWA
jgi:non-specific protein-tyrosine kinase